MEGWNPMEEDFHSTAFNSYDRGPGRHLPMEHLPQHRNRNQGPKPVQLYVTGIPLEFSEDGLQTIFRSHGSLRSRCGEIKPTMTSKYGFVDFPSLPEAHQALDALNGAPPYKLRIQFARSKEDRQRMDKAVINERENIRQNLNKEFLLETPPRQKLDNFQPSQQPNLRITRVDGCSRNVVCHKDNLHDSEVERTPPNECLIEHFMACGPSQRSALRTALGNNMRDTDNGVVERRILDPTDEYPSSIVTHQLAQLPCSYCKLPGGFRCQRCKVWYCGQTCQFKDWPQHKRICEQRQDDAASVLNFNGIKKQDDSPNKPSVIVHTPNTHSNYTPNSQNNRPNSQNSHSNHVSNNQNNVQNSHNDHSRQVPSSKSPNPKDRPKPNQNDTRGPRNDSFSHNSRDNTSFQDNPDTFKKPAPVGPPRKQDGTRNNRPTTPQRSSNFRGGNNNPRDGRGAPTPQNQSGFRGNNRDRTNNGPFRPTENRPQEQRPSGFVSETDVRTLAPRDDRPMFHQENSKPQSGFASETGVRAPTPRGDRPMFRQENSKPQEQRQSGFVSETDARNDYGRGRTSVRGALPAGALRRPHSKPPDLQSEATGERTSSSVAEFFGSGPCKVQVCYIVSPDELYVQKVSDSKTLNDLSVEIHQEATCAKKLNIPFVPDELCIALYNDGCWYRAKVLKVQGNVHEVYFVDYGNTETVQLGNMRLLPMKLRSTSAQAEKCALAKMAATGVQWKAEDIDGLRMLLSEQEVDCSLVMEHQGKALVDLIDSEGNSVSDLMIKLSFAKASPLPQTDTKPTPENKQPNFPAPNKPTPHPTDDKKTMTPPVLEQKILPVSTRKPSPPPMLEKMAPPVSETKPMQAEERAIGDSTHSIVKDAAVKAPLLSILSSLHAKKEAVMASVTWIANEKQFWVAVYDEEVLQKVGDASITLGQAFEKDCIGYNPSVGQVVSAKSSDGDCYRAYVKNKSKSMYSVLFLDFGNEEDVPAVAPLPPALFSLASPCIQLTSEVPMKIELNQTILLRLTSSETNFVTFTQIDGEGHHELSELIGKSWFSSLTEDTDSGVSSPVTLPVIQDSFVMFSSLPKRSVGQSFEGLVVWIESAREVYLQSSNDAELLEVLMVKVTDMVQTCGDQKLVLAVDQVVLARFEDGIWYRAKVDAVSGETVFVHFMDYGNKAKLTVNDLKACPLELAKDAPFAIHVSLEGMEGLTTDESVTLVQEPWKVQLVDTACGVPSVRLHGANGWFGAQQEKPATSPKPAENQSSSQASTPKAELVKQSSPARPQNASPKEEKLCTKTFSDQPYIPLPVGQKIVTTVSSVSSPDLIFVNHFSKDSEMQKFNELTATIQEYCASAKPKPDFPIEQASLCLALFHEDKQWYRAVLLWKKPPEVRVLFIDYGNMETISIQELLPIPERFMELPIQAVQCRMHGILPEKWATIVTEKLKLCLMASPVELDIICSNDDGSYVVDILSARLALVNEGLLKPDPAVKLPPLPQTSNVDVQKDEKVDAEANAAEEKRALILAKIEQLKEEIASLGPK